MKRFIDITFLFTVFLVPFIPTFGRIDIVGPQFLYLSFCILIYSSLRLLFHKRDNLILNNGTLIYLGFIIFGIISIFTAFNQIASLIEISRFITVISYLIFYYSIIKNNKFEFKYFIYFIACFASIEALYIFSIFVENYDFLNPPNRLREFQGLAYNQNVASLSILTKTPVLLFLFNKKKSIFFKSIILLLIGISIFDLFIIGTRSAIYGLGVLAFLLTIIFFINKNKSSSFKLTTIIFFITLIIVSGFSQSYLYQNSKDKINVEERIANVFDESSNYRLELWSDAVKMLKDNPLFGVGIGNYKIKSLEYGKRLLSDYEVPYHAHNDFLHIFSEIGYIGGFLYLLFFAIPFYLLVFKKKNIKEGNLNLAIFLLLSFVAICIDSFFNFPRYRPYSLINLIVILSLFYNCFKFKQEIILSNKWIIFFLVGNLISFYFLFKENNSFKDQYPLYVEYNFFQDQIITPIEEILTYEDEIPNISTVTIPIKIAKARYLFLDGQYEKAKSLIFKGQRHNPYLGIGDEILARIYLRENNLDSAYYYSKKSVDKLPNSIGHITYFQIILEKMGDIDQIINFFEEKKNINDELIWQNYAISLTTLKRKKNIDFTQNDKSNIKEALLKFPSNELLKAADKLIEFGDSTLPIADEFDIQAFDKFNSKQYEKAIDNWLRAIEIIPNEDSYYLNIAHSYILMDQLEKSLEFLKKIEENNLKSTNGKFEFLLSSIFIKKGNNLKACEFARTSIKLGYNDSSKLVQLLNCIN